MHFLCLPFTNVACSDDIDESGSSDLVIFGNFLVFSFSFSQVQAIIHSFFPKVLLDFGVVTHRLLAYHRQNVFKITGVVHKQSQLSVGVGRRCKLCSHYIFSTSSSPWSILSDYSLSIIYSNLQEFYLFGYECWLSYLLAIE